MRLIDGTQSLIYKIELAAAGMVDGHRSRHRSTRERLTNLRAHQDAFESSTVRFHPLELKGWHVHILPASGGVMPYMSDKSMKLFRPPSASRYIPARVWSFDMLPVQFHVRACEVDISQGILALFATAPYQK